MLYGDISSYVFISIVLLSRDGEQVAGMPCFGLISARNTT